MPLSEAEELELLELEEAEYQDSLKAKAPKPQQTSLGEAQILGASQALPVGKPLAPVSGLIEKGIAKLDPTLSPENYQEMYGDKSIGELGQETKKLLIKANEEHPIGYPVGQAFGQMALTAPFAAITGPAAATKAAIATDLGVQGALGAFGGYNETEGTVKEKLKEAAKQGAIAAGTAGLFKAGGALFKGAGKAAGEAAETFEKASTKAAKNALGVTNKITKDIGGRKAADDMVRVLQKEGLFTKGIGLDKVAEQVSEHAQHAANTLDSLYSGPLGRSARIAVEDLKTAIKNRVASAVERAKEIHPAKLAQLDQINELITRRLGESGVATNQDLWELTKDIGAKAWEKGVLNENLSVFQDAWKILKDASELGIKRSALGPETFEQIQKANKIYRAASQMGKALDEKLIKEGNRGVVPGLRSMVSMGVGGAVGGIPGAALGAGVEHLGQKYGAQVISKAAKGTEKVLKGPTAEKILKLAPKLGRAGQAISNAASRGAAAISSNHYVLMQTSAKYREQYKKATEGDKSE